MGFLSVNISALILAVKTYYLGSMFSASFRFRMFEFKLKLPLIDEKAGVLKTMPAVTILKRFSVVLWGRLDSTVG